jgi:hypothetical protein
MKETKSWGFSKRRNWRSQEFEGLKKSSPNFVGMRE